ncbi:hypothetical protein [Paraburkholderia youngii]|uniref:hypothetical protein n=1 Tax=Paraburkholderia youngii TaxID=2782701 RepID=UPI003D23B9BA
MSPSISFRSGKCTVLFRLAEEEYADASGKSYEAAETAAMHANAYPVVYPEPFGTVGCGFGPLNTFVKSQCDAVASELRLDVEVCNQFELIVTLACGTRSEYEKFIKLVGERVTKVGAWILNAKDLWPASAVATHAST